jgi:hypothetical protein
VPRICFVNKMDRMGANFLRCADMVVSNLGATPCILQLPIGAEDEFEGIIDLVTMQEIVYDSEDLGATWKCVLLFFSAESLELLAPCPCHAVNLTMPMRTHDTRWQGAAHPRGVEGAGGGVPRQDD